jgi:hypothetical protein
VKNRRIKIPFPKWEYRKIDHHPGNMDELNNLGKNGWQLSAISEGFCYLKREIEEVETKNPYQSTLHRWNLYKCNDIHANIVSDLRSLLGALRSNPGIFPPEIVNQFHDSVHTILYGFNCVNNEPGMREHITAAACGKLHTQLIELQFHYPDLGKLIKPIIRNCDKIFYYSYGYDVLDIDFAPDMIEHFLDRKHPKLLIALISLIISVIITSPCVVLLNWISPDLWFFQSRAAFSHYLEWGLVLSVSVAVALYISEMYSDGKYLTRSVLTMLWKARWYCIFIPLSHAKRWLRQLVSNTELLLLIEFVFFCFAILIQNLGMIIITSLFLLIFLSLWINEKLEFRKVSLIDNSVRYWLEVQMTISSPKIFREYDSFESVINNYHNTMKRQPFYIVIWNSSGEIYDVQGEYWRGNFFSVDINID